MMGACGLADCHKPTKGPEAAAAVDSGAVSDLATLARAEDQRRASEVSDALRTSHDVEIRRGAARALARIGDPEWEGALFAHSTTRTSKR